MLADTVRIASSRLDQLLRQAEEMLALKLIAEQRSGDLRAMGAFLGNWEKRWEKAGAQLRTARQLQKELQARANGNADKAAALAELIEFLDWAQQDYHELAGRLQDLQTRAEDDERTAAAMVEGLL